MAAKLLQKKKCGSGKSGGVASHIYKQASLVGLLIIVYEQQTDWQNQAT